MDTRAKRYPKKSRRVDETPEQSDLPERGNRIEFLTKSYLKTSKSPLRFATKEEMERREDDELCSKHGAPIIAFEEKSNETLCEKCVYLGKFETPVFTAVVAKQIKKRFDSEYITFEKLCQELISIDQAEVRNRIQGSVTQFFDAIRTKCDQLEEKAVAKIENSTNLGELVRTLESMHAYMEENRVAEKYDTERTNLDVKVSDLRYTYVCQRKSKFDQTISELEADNKKLADAVEKAQRMISAIFDCDQNQLKIEQTLNDLASGLMRIDEKHPDFLDMKGSERHHKKKSSKSQEEPDVDMVKQEINFSASEHKDGNWKAEDMHEAYCNKEGALWKREIDGNEVKEQEIMKLKLHLQKVLTVPSGRSSKVFLMGGSKDSDGKLAINNCYEVNIKKKTMTAIDKLASPKLTFAAALSPDAKNIYISGGSTGENKATNECEVFNVSKKKWSSMPSLNQPRFSASMIICENEDMYCFGGVDNDPKDPTKFLTLKSIETISVQEENAQWEVLKLILPYKTSSPGAISLGHRAFIVFGGWNKDHLSRSVIIRETENEGVYATEESGDLVTGDTFVSNGLVSRNEEDKTTILFGTSHIHVFNENDRSFSIIE